MGFSRLEYWSGLPCPPPGDPPNPGMQPSPRYCKRILYNWAAREAPLLFCWGPSNGRFAPFLSLSPLSPLLFLSLWLSLLFSERVGRAWSGWGAVSWKERGFPTCISRCILFVHMCWSYESESGNGLTVWCVNFPLIFLSRVHHPEPTFHCGCPTVRRSLISVAGCFLYTCIGAKSIQSRLTLCTYGLWPARLLWPWSSPGKNTGVGCHAILQVIFQTQG